MRNYNIIRPIMLLVTAYLVKNIVTLLCAMLGMNQEAAENVGFMAMVLTALIIYMRWNKQRQNKSKNRNQNQNKK